MGEAYSQFESGFLRLRNDYARMLSDYRESNMQLAEDFNIFSLVGVEHLEVSTHSAILRELLDSQGSHGQGNLFFIEFLSMLADKGIIPKEDINKHSPTVFDNYACDAERAVATGRIDIIVERLDGDFPYSIIIENKVYAVDQYEQIERYWAELEKKKHIPVERKEIIYLTPKGGLPSEDSIESIKRKELEDMGALHYISYNTDVSCWLENALNKVKSPKIEYTVRQYIELVRSL